MSTGTRSTAMRATDWPQVRAVYIEGIEAGNATFETDAPEWDAWDAAHLPTCRLVARNGDAVIGGGAEPGIPPPRLCRRGRDQRVRGKNSSGHGGRPRIARPADRRI